MRFWQSVAIGLFPAISFAQPVDFLGMANPIRLGDEGYFLAQSSKDGSGVIRQVHVPPGQLADDADKRLRITYLPDRSLAEAARDAGALNAAGAGMILMQAPTLGEDEGGSESWLEFMLIGRGDMAGDVTADESGPALEWHARRYVRDGAGVVVFDLMLGVGDVPNALSLQYDIARERPALIAALRDLPLPETRP